MMPLDIAAIILQCAVSVHPETATAIILHESRGNPYALNTQVQAYYPERRADAERILARAMQEGRSTDIGLMQVNSQWLKRFNLAATDLLDPCTNIRVGTTILSQNYADAWAKHGKAAPALLAALSLYNTGNESRGLRNGYVGHVTKQVGVRIPAATSAVGGTKALPSLSREALARRASLSFAGTGPESDPTPGEPLFAQSNGAIEPGYAVVSDGVSPAPR